MRRPDPRHFPSVPGFSPPTTSRRRCRWLLAACLLILLPGDGTLRPDLYLWSYETA